MNVIHDDRRNFMRMDINCNIHYAAEGGTPDKCAQLRNLSACGLQFICEEDFAAGQRLEVLVEPPGEITPPLRGLATVLRSKPLEEGGYAVACNLRVDG